MDSGEVIVHGPPLTDAGDIAQLRHLSEGEVAVVVPRQLLVDWTRRTRLGRPRIIDLDELEALFRTFNHSA